MRRFEDSQLVVASHNVGKKKEIEDLLTPFSLKILGAGDLGVEEAEETELTFEGNALLKAKHCMNHTGLASLSDDSGLVIPLLNGEPGVFSARWAERPATIPGHNIRDFSYAMSLVEEKLQGQEDVSAYMVSVLCLVWPDGHHRFFEGRAYGTLTFPPRGTNGFGYDPIFKPHGQNKTFGELSRTEKAALSHRTLAFQKLVNEVLKNQVVRT